MHYKDKHGKRQKFWIWPDVQEHSQNFTQGGVNLSRGSPPTKNQKVVRFGLVFLKHPFLFTYLSILLGFPSGGGIAQFLPGYVSVC